MELGQVAVLYNSFTKIQELCSYARKKYRNRAKQFKDMC